MESETLVMWLHESHELGVSIGLIETLDMWSEPDSTMEAGAGQTGFECPESRGTNGGGG